MKDQTDKAKPETITALTSASEKLASVISAAKSGQTIDPKGIGSIVDELNKVKGAYPTPATKQAKPGEEEEEDKDKKKTPEEEAAAAAAATKTTKKMDVAEFVTYAKSAFENLQKEEGEPATRVARMAQLQTQIEAAKKQVDAGQPQVEIEVVETKSNAMEVSPLATQGAPFTGYQDLTNSIASLTETVKGLADRVPPKEETVTKDNSWPDDLAGDPSTSKDPAVSWGTEKKNGVHQWGPDVK